MQIHTLYVQKRQDGFAKEVVAGEKRSDYMKGTGIIVTLIIVIIIIAGVFTWYVFGMPGNEDPWENEVFTGRFKQEIVVTDTGGATYTFPMNTFTIYHEDIDVDTIELVISCIAESKTVSWASAEVDLRDTELIATFKGSTGVLWQDTYYPSNVVSGPADDGWFEILSITIDADAESDSSWSSLTELSYSWIGSLNIRGTSGSRVSSWYTVQPPNLVSFPLSYPMRDVLFTWDDDINWN